MQSAKSCVAGPDIFHLRPVVEIKYPITVHGAADVPRATGRFCNPLGRVVADGEKCLRRIGNGKSASLTESQFRRASQAQRASPRETEDSSAGAAGRLKTFPPARRKHGLPRTTQSLMRPILCRCPAQARLPVEVEGASARSGHRNSSSSLYANYAPKSPVDRFTQY
jgi:hypothetical protein